MSEKHLKRIDELTKQLNQRERELRQCGHTVAELAEKLRETKQRKDELDEALLSCQEERRELYVQVEECHDAKETD